HRRGLPAPLDDRSEKFSLRPPHGGAGGSTMGGSRAVAGVLSGRDGGVTPQGGSSMVERGAVVPRVRSGSERGGAGSSAPRDGLVRQRLLDAVEPHGGQRLTVLVGTVGSGKTTVLQQWVVRTDQDVVWLRVPSGADEARCRAVLARTLLGAGRGSAPGGPFPDRLEDVVTGI